MKNKFTIGLILLTLIINLTGYASIARADKDEVPEISSESAVLMDARTGQILFEKNKNKKQFPASVTKIMTGMLALEKADLNAALTMSEDAVFSIERGSSHIALDTGEVLSLQDALYALSIESANDAANGIAEYISGDTKKFAALMNERAQQLGALKTHFVNAHGLDDPEHYTTAYDMALIMRQAIKDPEFNKIFGAHYYEMSPTNLREEKRFFHSKNSLLNGRYGYDGITASKLGWTTRAGNTLVTAASRNGRELIVVVMNSQAYQGTYQDTMKLFNFGFEDFNEVVMLSAASGDNVALGKNDSPGQPAVKPAADVIRLLHKSLSPEDVSITYETLREDGEDSMTTEVAMRLKETSDYMYQDLGSLVIVGSLEGYSSATTTFGEVLGNIFSVAFKGFKILILVLLGVFVLILVLRQINQWRLRKKKMARSQQYRINYIDHDMTRRNENRSNRPYQDRDLEN